MDHIPFIAGFTATFLTHPLEYYKIILQNQQKTNLRLCARGILINSFTYGSHYGIYFPVYEHLQRNFGLGSFASGFVAQGISGMILNPMWVVRTKRISLGESYREIVSKTNMTGYYRGFNASMLLCFQTGITWSILSELNYQIPQGSDFVNPLLAKVVSGTILYPLDTIRTILRTRTDTSLGELFKNLSKPRMYFNGLSFYLLRSVPSFVLTNWIYQKLKN